MEVVRDCEMLMPVSGDAACELKHCQLTNKLLVVGEAGRLQKVDNKSKTKK